VPGDIIVGVDGKSVQTVAQLFARLDDHQVGDTVRVRVLRDDRNVDISVKLEGGGE
jgi:S1-C subfamily serine protease